MPAYFVLKFGGTSVSSATTWATIAQRADVLLKSSDDCRVWIVVSAVSQVTNHLLRCLDECVDEILDDEQAFASFDWIRKRHQALALELGLGDGRTLPPEVESLLVELRRILEGARLTGEVSARLRARVLAMGELCSSHLGRSVLERSVDAALLGGPGVARVDARTLLHATERPAEQDAERFLNADVQPRIARDEAEKMSGCARLVVTQGFIASTERGGHTCVLGRGGSDTSGALFAAMLGAQLYEIWTDVHGMFTCDPRHVPRARLIREISYREAQELAAMGAKVLHPRCLGPAAWGGIAVEVHNTMDPLSEHRTRICADLESADGGSGDGVTVMAVSRRKDQVMLTLENFNMWGASGFLSRAFAPFDRLGISVDLIATSQYAVGMTLDHVPDGVEGAVFGALLKELEKLGSVRVVPRCSVVSIVGRRLRTALHLLASTFLTLSSHRGEIHMVSESTEDLNLSFVIDDPGDGSVDELVGRLHAVLFETSCGEEAVGASVGNTPAMRPQSPATGIVPPGTKTSLFGPTWTELKGGKLHPTPSPTAVTLPASAPSPPDKQQQQQQQQQQQHEPGESGIAVVETKRANKHGSAVDSTPPTSPLRQHNTILHALEIADAERMVALDIAKVGLTGRSAMIAQQAAVGSDAVPAVRRVPLSGSLGEGDNGGGTGIEERLARLEAASVEQTRLLSAILNCLDPQQGSSG